MIIRGNYKNTVKFMILYLIFKVFVRKWCSGIKDLDPVRKWCSGIKDLDPEPIKKGLPS